VSVLHHCVYQQEVRKHGGDLGDPRNFMVVSERRHERHHSRTEALSLEMLPDPAYEYASELLGPEKAYNYLRRRYSGQDPRLDALLERTYGV
jgi:hypothetical protein